MRFEQRLAHPHSAHAASNAGIIDGAQHPDLIPDDRAIHMILLTSSWSDRSSDIAKKKALALSNSLGFSAQDQSVFVGLAQQYRQVLEQLQDEQGSIPADGTRSQDEARVFQQKQTLLANTVSMANQQLTASGVVRLAALAQRAKRTMKLFSLPNMPHPVARNFFDRFRALFSTSVVHAQMSPYGSTHSG